ncbi:hypothetical protein LTR36_007061 [Oleoguttula mirabilis]|uniref:non-specific serine/threonine protein kinase n=1 Tax=Oleoguttula mirabilis TaxID=1507867 RepID=A0AAV9JAT6_9PEZI|nr:hypothetical protein LTR36_007061 [Oleoguttula mirabilis]
MSRLRSQSPALSDGEVLSGDEEKAISTHADRDRDSKVNPSARHQNGSSSRASRPGADLSRDPYYHFRDAAGVVKYEPPARERSRSPYRRDKSRSRSPFRADKPASGEKRRHEDDHYNAKGGSDSRRFKVHYEDKPGSRGGIGYRSQRSHAEADQPEPTRGHQPHADRGARARGGSNRNRERSRSPFRQLKTERAPQDHPDAGRGKMHSRASVGQSSRDERRGSTPSVTERESTPQASHAKDDAKIKISLSQQSKQPNEGKPQTSQELVKSAADAAPEKAPQQPQLSEADIVEQRRKRREAIKNKHKSQPGLLVQALEQSMPSAPATPAHDSSAPVSEQHSPPSSVDSSRTPQRDSPPDSPAAIVVADDEELANRHQDDGGMNDDEGPSAADYDPNLDLQEDRPDHKRRGLEAPLADTAQAGEASIKPTAAAEPKKDFDMFADDDEDDMFAATDSSAQPVVATKQGKTLDQSLLDNWDYPDGHYRIILGELLDGRYAVQQQIGKGTFATVVSAQDTRTGNPVAIKIAANNETMYKAGQREMDFLQILNQNDPEDKKHIIRLLRHFDHKGHMCIVFEALSADLRDVLKKFGRNVGLNLKAIRSYAQQMFLALSHMKKCQILHADLKPDNILVSEKRSVLKVCDLGTASFAEDAEVTPYLVSRFYRAPEVILGMPFDYAIDMWSIGCTLFELYTGRIMFAGADNNQMLRTIQECRGKLPIRMLKRSTLAEQHFDLDGTFFSQERDKVTGKTVVRPVHFNKLPAGKDLRSRLAGNAKGLAPAELREHASFVDLMEKCLQLDPAKRVTPNDALRHGFIAHGGLPPVEAKAKAVKVVPAMPAPRLR